MAAPGALLTLCERPANTRQARAPHPWFSHTKRRPPGYSTKREGVQGQRGPCYGPAAEKYLDAEDGILYAHIVQHVCLAHALGLHPL